MKKTRSTTLRRAWPSSEFSDRASERTRSRSEKDYRLHKHYPKHFISHSPRGFMITVWWQCAAGRVSLRIVQTA
ncbi:Storkhead-box protein 2 [Anabarilius grahami]|uniref:Storkhead-box protein 2 n=1 Tax=Anabarilius grahami TaxID=495550 RepID=A0A3N0YVP5_ANAGA|nr:Storkhead-box protein 2 [Anabarilius grahami]